MTITEQRIAELEEKVVSFGRVDQASISQIEMTDETHLNLRVFLYSIGRAAIELHYEFPSIQEAGEFREAALEIIERAT